MSFIVAVDGPAGSGKGTITKQIEKEMGLINLDTGATYRCVALETIKNGLTPEDESQIIQLLDQINIQIEKGREEDSIFLNGEDVTKEIREQKVADIVSPISSIVAVREKMIALQRKLAQGKNVIMEGRDIGTVVFPDADVKFYLDAKVEERASRRYKENIKAGMKTNYEKVLESIKQRDENDKNKKVGALKKAEDAIVIDTTSMPIEKVVGNMKDRIIEKMKIKKAKESEMILEENTILEEPER